MSKGCDQSSGQHRTDAGNFIEPHAYLVGSVPGPDQPVELQDLLLDPAQLSPECRETGTSYLRNSLVVWIRYDIEQFLDTVTPDRRNDPELGKMGPNCIDHRGLLTDEQMAGAVEHQAALLLGGLGRYKPHVGPGDCLANGLCVSRIVLLPLDVGLHIGRRDQPHGVTQCLQLARPVVRRGAGFDTDQTGRQLLEERQDVAALQLAANDHLAASVDAVNLENRLGDVETDCRYRLHGSLL